MLKLVLLFTKALLGLLVSFTLAFLFYFLSIPIITMVLRPESINGLWATVVIIGLGASVGSFIGWFDIKNKLPVHFFLYAVAFAGALIGAYIGLQQGIELQPNQDPWRYGLPVLRQTVKQAVIWTNVPLLIIWVFQELRLLVRVRVLVS